jgi:ribonuclease Z
MKVVFLGTGGTIPTERRKHPSVALKREGELFLFDCGEGCQTQIFRARLGIGAFRAVFLSHLHGDHVLGIPGLLMTMSQSSRSQPLLLVGPAGVARWIDHLCEDLNFHPSFDISVKETDSGPVLVSPQYQVDAFPLEHRVFTLGYCFYERDRPGRFQTETALSLGVPRGPLWGRLQSGFSVTLEGGTEVHPAEVLGPPRPGRKIVYAVDSRPCKTTVQAAIEADLLVHDGMFLSEDADKAQERGHSTVAEAAQVASEARTKQLALTHISPRYRGVDQKLLEEASLIFPHTILGRDLLEVEIPRVDD